MRTGTLLDILHLLCEPPSLGCYLEVLFDGLIGEKCVRGLITPLLAIKSGPSSYVPYPVVYSVFVL